MTEPVVIRRSAWKMWVMALAGIPLVVIATDVLTNRRITDALRELLFRPEDTQIFEPRDVIWAWAMLVVGVVLAGWGLKELMVPSAVIRTRKEGLVVRVGGPFSRAVIVPWDQVVDIGSASVDDEGDVLPVMWIRLTQPDVLPDQPWGARWIDENTLALLAADWDRDASEAAAVIADFAISTTSPEEQV